MRVLTSIYCDRSRSTRLAWRVVDKREVTYRKTEEADLVGQPLLSVCGAGIGPAPIMVYFFFGAAFVAAFLPPVAGLETERRVAASLALNG